MAKSQINTKSSSYQRDKEAFLKELKQFNESKTIPYKIPKVNGIEIDLYHFYTLVQQKGGISKVNQTDSWDTFLRPLRLPHPCINGSTLLKRIYSMYLEKYERAKGPPGRDDDNDIDDDPRRGRGGGMPRITFSGGTYISGEDPPPDQTQPEPAKLPTNQMFSIQPPSIEITKLVRTHKMSRGPRIPKETKIEPIFKPKPEEAPPKFLVFPKPLEPKSPDSPKPTTSMSELPVTSKHTRRKGQKSAFSKRHYSKKKI